MRRWARQKTGLGTGKNRPSIWNGPGRWWRKNRPALIAEFLEGWLDGRFTEAEIQERISALGLELPEPVGVTLVHLENKDNAEIGGEWDEDLLFYAAENMANEVFQTLRPVSTCRNSAGELVLLTAGEPRAVWEAAGEQLKHLLQTHLPVDVFLTRRLGDTLQGLPAAYEGASEDLRTLLETPQLVRDAKNTSKKTLPGRNSPSQRRRTIRMSPRST